MERRIKILQIQKFQNNSNIHKIHSLNVTLLTRYYSRWASMVALNEHLRQEQFLLLMLLLKVLIQDL